jgi:hypothetical protein
VPNGSIISDYDKMKILQGFKTYNYITSEKNYRNKYKPLKNINKSWKKIELKTIEKGKKLKFYLDPGLKHPNFPNEYAVRAKQEKKYCIILGGGAARLNKNLVNYEQFDFLRSSSQ